MVVLGQRLGFLIPVFLAKKVLFLSDIAFKALLTIGIQVNMLLFYGAIYK